VPEGSLALESMRSSDPASSGAHSPERSVARNDIAATLRILFSWSRHDSEPGAGSHQAPRLRLSLNLPGWSWHRSAVPRTCGYPAKPHHRIGRAGTSAIVPPITSTKPTEDTEAGHARRVFGERWNCRLRRPADAPSPAVTDVMPPPGSQESDSPHARDPGDHRGQAHNWVYALQPALGGELVASAGHLCCARTDVLRPCRGDWGQRASSRHRSGPLWLGLDGLVAQPAAPSAPPQR
jgi:hypothetical protein